MKKGTLFRMHWLRPMQVFLLVLFGFLSVSFSHQTLAIAFGVELFDEESNPITEPVDVRLSLWNIMEVRDDDVDANGNINTSALHYGGYTHVFEGVILDQNGQWFTEPSMVEGFPALTRSNFIGQLEWKFDNDSNSAYQIYDGGASPFQDTPRFLLVAETIAHEVIDFGHYTSSNFVILDGNNDASSEISLVFGETLAKSLSYDLVDSRFEFSDNLDVAGVLTVNGVPVSTGKSVNTLYINRNTASGQYATIGEFIYSGTSVEGAITAIYGTLSVDAGLGVSYDIRIFDTTNGQVIAENTGLTNNTQAIQSFGTVNNLPEGNALFLVQARRVGGLINLIRLGSLHYQH